MKSRDASSSLPPVALSPKALQRVEKLFDRRNRTVARRTDRMFIRLMFAQWVVAIVLAFTLTPRTWAGSTSEVHVHVYGALFFGGLFISLPAYLSYRRPGAKVTRHVIAGAQMLWSGLLIHLCGGRIETHFHIFGSLALLAFYRDLYILIPATLVTAGDHLLRGMLWPESIFGVADPVWWRAFEHAGWVLFIDVFLVLNCKHSLDTLRALCTREVRMQVAEDQARTAIGEKIRTQERARAEEEIASARKMEAVGQIAAGVAHEINTPTQYVSDNVVFLERAFGSFNKVVGAAKDVVNATEDDSLGQIKALAKVMKRGKLDFLTAEIPRALSESREGLERVATIVSAMKEFSHPSDGEQTPVDLVRTINTTLTVARNEWKYVAEVETDFPEDLSLVPLVRDEFSQVILNIVVNAAHAISDVTDDGATGKGTIRIEITQDESWTELRISDTGGGIAADHLEKVFEPFFTTKEVGKGTGQGLAIAHAVVVKRHRGRIHVESEVGEGTTFVIGLPTEGTTGTEEQAA